jgi:Ricin-type beta-trefoil lectin domain
MNAAVASKFSGLGDSLGALGEEYSNGMMTGKLPSNTTVCDPSKVGSPSGAGIVSLSVLVAALAYLALRPVTLPCVGCDQGGLFYKCMDGTGLGTVTCEAWKRASDVAKGVAKRVASVSEYAKELTQFTSKLPHFLWEFVQTLKEQLVKVAAEIYARVKTVSAYALKKMKEIGLKLKDAIWKTWEEVYDKVIRPMVAALMKYVVDPVMSLLNKIIDFAKMVLSSVSNALGKVKGIVSQAYNAVYHAAGTIADAVEYVMRESAKLIEISVSGLSDGLNNSMAKLVEGAQDAINGVTGAVNTSIAGIEGFVNGTVGGVTGAINTSVNKVGSGVSAVTNEIQGKVNQSMQQVLSGTGKVLGEVTGGIEDSVNVLASGVATGVGSILNETEDVVNSLGKMLETSVNGAIGVINKGLSAPIESTINSTADIVEKALDGVMAPVRAITGGYNKMSNFKLDLKIIDPIQPFGFLGNIPTPKTPKIGTIDIPDIGGINIKDVNLSDVAFVKPSAPLGAAPLMGRARLNAAISAAEKNWKIASLKARDDYAKEDLQYDFDMSTKRKAQDHDGFTCAKPNLGVGLGVYGHLSQSTDYSFLPKLNHQKATQGVSSSRNPASARMLGSVHKSLGAPAVLQSGRPFILQSEGKNLCLDDNGGGAAKLHPWTCDANSTNQQFVYDAATRTIRSFKKNNLCVDDGGTTVAGGAKMSLYECNSNNFNQLFVYDPVTGMFKSTTKNLCIDTGGATANGQTQFHLYTCDANNLNQRFTLQYLGAAAPADKLVKSIRITGASSDKYMNIAGMNLLSPTGAQLLTAQTVDAAASRMSSMWDPTMGVSALWDNNPNTLAHSNAEVAPWALVVLKSSAPVATVDVINRVDCCKERLIGAVLEAFNQNGELIKSQKLDASAVCSMSLEFMIGTPAYKFGAFGIAPWGSAANFADKSAQYIWNSTTPETAQGGDVTFGTQYHNQSSTAINATLHMIVDDYAKIFFNGQELPAAGGGWTAPNYYKQPVVLVPGLNQCEIVATNAAAGYAGLLMSVIDATSKVHFSTGTGTWLATAGKLPTAPPPPNAISAAPVVAPTPTPTPAPVAPAASETALVYGNNGSATGFDWCARSNRACVSGIDSTGKSIPCTSGGVAGGNNGFYCSDVALTYGNNGSVSGNDWCARSNKACLSGKDGAGNTIPCTSGGIVGQNNGFYCVDKSAPTPAAPAAPAVVPEKVVISPMPSSTPAYVPRKGDIVIKGISIPAPKMPAAPSIALKLPDMSINLKASEAKIPRISASSVKIPKVPDFSFSVNLQKKIPEVPNIVEGVGIGVKKLRDVLGEFFKPVWAALASLFGYVNYAMSMIWHFFTKEVTWARIRDGVMYALRKGYTGIRTLVALTYEEVVLPMVAVIKWIGVHLIDAAKVFAKMTLAFLKDMGSKLMRLGEDVFAKVKPFLQQAAMITGGVAMYSVGSFLDRVPPFKYIPCSTTMKVYIVVLSLFLLLCGAQLQFAKDFITGFLTRSFWPFLFIDNKVDAYVGKNWTKLPGGIKGFATLFGFDPVKFRPAC